MARKTTPGPVALLLALSFTSFPAVFGNKGKADKVISYGQAGPNPAAEACKFMGNSSLVFFSALLTTTGYW